MYEVKIIGTGSYVPPNVVTNDDIAQFVDTNDKWISERTGIKERRISKDENTSTIALNAAKVALENSNIKPEDIDLIVIATATQDYFFPSTACLVQKELGAVNATCFDVSAACTGFIYGVSTATQFIKTGQSKTALVIGAEVLSKIMDWSDRNTCVLFGDAAGAVVLQRSDEKGVISIFTGSDGTRGEFLACSAVPLNNVFNGREEINENKITMNGREIFKFATKIMNECIGKVLENTEYSLEDIKYIVPHQANIRIIEYTAKKLNVDISKFYVNLDKYGNTSGASIPVALDEMVQKGLLNKGDKIILVGFGGGVTYGAELIEW